MSAFTLPDMSFRPLTLFAAIASLALLPAACGSDPLVPDIQQPVQPPPPPPPTETPNVDGDGASGTITVSAATTYQTMDGFGTSLRLWDDPHVNGLHGGASTGGIVMTEAQKDTILNLLYSPTAGIGLNRIRASLIFPGWQPQPGVRIVADGPYPGPQATRTIDFIKKALIRNPSLKTFFQVLYFDSWVSNSTPPFEIAAYIKASLDFARSKGHEPAWLGVHNEPSYAPPKFSAETVRDVTVGLKRLLQADGYSTRVTAPDDVTDVLGAQKASVILANPEARSVVEALSIHLYGDLSPTEMAALARQYNLPLWMTEYDDRTGGSEIGWASAIVHEMIVTYNCAAVDMLYAFLGSPGFGSRQAEYITLNSVGTTYTGYTLTPAYYQMGHWSRYVTRGSVRIAAASTNPDVKVSAFVKDGKKVIVLVHSGTTSQSVSIPAGAYRVIRTQLSGSDRLADKGLFTSAVTLPKMSITTLVER